MSAGCQSLILGLLCTKWVGVRLLACGAACPEVAACLLHAVDCGTQHQRAPPQACRSV